MIKDLEKTDLGLTGIVYSELLKRDINVLIFDANTVEYAEKCVEHFNSLSEDVILTLIKSSAKYAFFMMEEVDDIEMDFDKNSPAEDILKYISDGTLYVDECEGDGIGYSVELNCEWEIEHGMQWALRDKLVVYVGPSEAISPWDEEILTDPYNFKNQI